MRYRWLLIIGIVLLSLAAWAQPEANATWLTIQLLQANDAPLPITAVNPPKILVYSLDGQTRTMVGQELANEEVSNEITIINLTPGKQELRLMLPHLGVMLEPKTVELTPGGNQLKWRLPPFQRVEGSLLLGEHLVPASQNVQGFLVMVNRSNCAPTPVDCTDGCFRLSGLPPATYRLLLLYERQYYGLNEFTVPAEPAGAVTAPTITLHKMTMAVTVEVTKPNRTTIPSTRATVTFTSAITPDFLASIPLIIGQTDHATILLPAGKWNWMFSCVGYKLATGAITGTDDAPEVKLAITAEPL